MLIWLRIFIIFGMLLFIKYGPKWLGETLGIKDFGTGLTISFFKKLKEIPLVGTTLGAAGGAVKGAVSGFASGGPKGALLGAAKGAMEGASETGIMGVDPSSKQKGVMGGILKEAGEKFISNRETIQQNKTTFSRERAVDAAKDKIDISTLVEPNLTNIGDIIGAEGNEDVAEELNEYFANSGIVDEELQASVTGSVLLNSKVKTVRKNFVELIESNDVDAMKNEIEGIRKALDNSKAFEDGLKAAMEKGGREGELAKQELEKFTANKQELSQRSEKLAEAISSVRLYGGS